MNSQTGSMPLVTVGIPTFNGAKTIREAINSIQKQTYTNLEILIIDNASTDETSKIISSILPFDSRIKYFKNSENLGAFHSFNSLVNKSKGEFFCWASSDDIRPSTFVEKGVERLLQSENSILYVPRVLVELDTNSMPIFMVRHRRERLTADRPHLLWSAKTFPSVGLYGLFRTSLMKKMLPIPNTLGGEELWNKQIILYGDIEYANEIGLCYRVPEQWRTTETLVNSIFPNRNHVVFFSFKSKLRRIIEMYIYLNRSMNMSPKKRNGIVFLFPTIIVLRHILSRFYVAVTSVIPIRGLRKSLGNQIFWLMSRDLNYSVLDTNLFRTRVIEPTMKLSSN